VKKEKIEISENNEALEISEAPKKVKKAAKPKKIKNQALLKRGGYAMAITAAVLAVIVVLNVLLTVLAERLPLEFDMTSDKKNSISAENIEYIKGVDKDVVISVCAKEDEYLTYMSSYAPDIYGVDGTYDPYYTQTLSLINKYDNYNQKIKVKFLNTQDASFSEITAKYSKEKLNFGDIIVSCGEGKDERYKIVNFQDIYELQADETYAAYGMTYYSITGNNVETALTSAIAYVTSTKDIKVAFLNGHSKQNYTDSYINLLETNNYQVDVISDSIINSLSDEYDAVFIVAPTSDFIASELEVLSKFLDNDGKYNKGLVFFADAAAPYLKNLYSFLAQWGIEVGEGIVFETNSQNHIPDEPTVLGSYPMVEDEILNNISMCITGYNVPLKAAFDQKGKITTTKLISTFDSVVAAPVGTSNSWTGYDKYTKQSLATVMQAKRYDYDDDNNLIENYVFAFSSTEFIHGTYSEYNDISNKDIAFQVAERAVGAEKTGISFISKTIENQSFAASVTESSRNVMSIIFVGVIPIMVVAAGVYVYIRRKNS
jgi:hypothetical protein